MVRFAFLFAFLSATILCCDARAQKPERERLNSLLSAGNYKEAFDGYVSLLTKQAGDYREIGDDIGRAVTCLNQLARIDEFDDFIERVVSANADNWRVLSAAASQYQQAVHQGIIVSGKYERGYRYKQNAKYAHSYERDRARALQLVTSAIERAQGAEREELARLYLQLADLLAQSQGAWKLQSLTPLGSLPDYVDGYYYNYSDASQGAPVDRHGDPILYALPKSFDEAKNDGERYRFALSQASEASPERKEEALLRWAQFLLTQFGTRTAADRIRVIEEADEGKKSEKTKESGVFALESLNDDETIARLASGIRRFKLADEYNPITIYKSLMDGGSRLTALRALAEIYQDRRQFSRAAEYWRDAFAVSRSDSDKSALDQIVGAWGQFEPIMSQPAGKPARISFRYRNGTSVRIEAHRIKLAELLEDSIDYLKSNPYSLK